MSVILSTQRLVLCAITRQQLQEAPLVRHTHKYTKIKIAAAVNLAGYVYD